MLRATRVLLVGEDEDTCALTSVVLTQAAVFDVVGPARSWVELANLLLALSPQVVLLDLDSPGQGALAALKMARQLSPQGRFIALTGDPKMDGPLLANLDAVLSKDAPIDHMLSLLGQPPEGELPSVQEVQSHHEAEYELPSVQEVQSHQEEGDDAYLPALGTVNLQAGPFGSFRSLATFQEAVGRLEGVRSVKVRRFHRGTLYSSVQYDGILPLGQRLAGLTQFRPRVIADRAGSIQLAIEAEA